MNRSRQVLLAPDRAWPGWPCVVRVGRRIEHAPSYYRTTAARRGHVVSVNLTLAGTGTLWELPDDGRPRGVGGWPLPRGHALLFVSREDDISYGYPPTGREPLEVLHVGLAGAAAVEMTRDLIDRHGRVLALDPDHPAVAALAALVPEAELARATIPAETGARLAFDLLAALRAGGPAERPTAGLVEQACALLLEAPAGRGVAATVARRLGVSREHLTRTFSAMLGTSPAAWLRRHRLARAARLLRVERLPMGEIARRCGYADAARFGAAFARAYGRSPAAFRRAAAQGGG